MSRRYKGGDNRKQKMLFPLSMDEYVTSTNPVRAIDEYVNSLNMEKLGFTNTARGVSVGQPAYPPSGLLKLYLYGYLNRIQSSRNLEKETHRNLEVIWLLKGLRPSYKTISDFRKNNRKAIAGVNRDFVILCKELDLYGCELVGIDGTFFRGNARKGSIFTEKRLQKIIDKIEKDISNYLQEIDAADKQGVPLEMEDTKLAEKLDKLKERQQKYTDKLNNLKNSDEKQISSIDEDARLLTKRGQTTAGYNVQCAVDEKHKLIVCSEVVNDGNDSRQLFPMAQKAQEILEKKDIKIAADTGYYNQKQIKECIDNGIVAYVAIPDKNKGIRKDGRYERKDFKFDSKENCYICPGGQRLEYSTIQQKNGKQMKKYSSHVRICTQCIEHDKCLPAKTRYRQIYRWEHEKVVEGHRKMMEQEGREYMIKRAALCEHPFGTMKIWLGWKHFLLRGLKKVRTEMNLLMISYNFKRVLNIIGIEKFREYCIKRKKCHQREGSSSFFCFFIMLEWILGPIGSKYEIKTIAFE